LWSYTGVMLIVGALALLYLAWRRQFFLLLCLLGPALILWINERYFTRYYTSVVLIFLLCAAVALAELTCRADRRVQTLIIAGVLVWGLSWLSFTITANTDPANLPLWSGDYREYVYSDASGFGIFAARDALIQHGATHVIG